ncbi:MAG: PhoH family protein [Methylococcales bacterium]|jgi:phosphate starvation-inducible PhoH-like protein
MSRKTAIKPSDKDIIYRRRDSRKTSKNDDFSLLDVVDLCIERRVLEPIQALTKAQGAYITAILENVITFGIGPAGTGKSYVVAGLAADMLREKKIDRIILSRPGVEAGEKFGFIPGELEEKYAPYIEPFRDIFNERLGRSQVDYLIKHKRICAMPLAFMRGRTFKNCWAILDEAQNTTPSQMKLFLTRIGDNCKVIIDGDIEQKDITTQSGLSDAVNKLKNTRKVGIVEFSVEDVVRSGIVKDILRAYSA